MLRKASILDIIFTTKIYEIWLQKSILLQNLGRYRKLGKGVAKQIALKNINALLFANLFAFQHFFWREILYQIIARSLV